MKSKPLDGETWVLVFDPGDEAFGGLESFAREHDLTAASLTGIGAFREATLGYFDWESKEYEELPVAEQVEVLSLVGDIAEQDGRPVVHAHVVLGLRDGSPGAAIYSEASSDRLSRSCSATRLLISANGTTPRAASP